MTPRTVLSAASLIAALGGVLLGIVPSTITDGTSLLDDTYKRNVDCGSPWFPAYSDASDNVFTTSPAEAELACQDAHGSRGTLGILLLGFGGAGTIALLATARRRDPDTAPAPHADDTEGDKP